MKNIPHTHTLEDMLAHMHTHTNTYTGARIALDTMCI